ncbi:hypothetical protein A3B87_02015 [Candidatus Kuenenbacteria bacterium RIFCSPHIGHO2_02_FULL_39_13]|uniref:Uncharacterized protein n=1 Tax=Candidatus Kuenenbacteria bacterium RIFCSPHIGHO2_02_FULL_39_13 TaxID=1798561 RepID=A0A1F6FL42_9BACT|nr:MAG: hypothetical protein A3B87_02015 [Candidatus Kuenenbacteria bacterium RIFCSPHIGHO2_02_FULL_39_13]
MVLLGFFSQDVTPQTVSAPDTLDEETKRVFELLGLRILKVESVEIDADSAVKHLDELHQAVHDLAKFAGQPTQADSTPHPPTQSAEPPTQPADTTDKVAVEPAKTYYSRVITTQVISSGQQYVSAYSAYSGYGAYSDYISYEDQARIAQEQAKNIAEQLARETAQEIARQDSLRLANAAKQWEEQWEEIGMRRPHYQPFPVDGSELDRFLWSLGKVESGHRYYIRNPYSGAYGKYQFIPSTWRLWANRYAQANGRNAVEQTPENQEAVARFKAQTLFGQYGSWRDVASIWFSGRPYYSFRRPWQISDGYISLPGYTGDVVRGMNQKQKK